MPIENASSGSGVKLGSTTYPVDNIKLSVKVDNTDVTDSSTAVGFKDTIDGRAEWTFTFDGYKSSTTADIPTGVTTGCILYMGAATYSGSVSIQTMGQDANVVNGVIKSSYAGKFHGAVSSSY